MEPVGFIEAEHARLRTKARRIDATSDRERLSLIADYLRDFEAHQQLIEDVARLDVVRARMGTERDQETPHQALEPQLRDALSSLDESARANLGRLMALRRRAIDRQLTLGEDYC